LCHQIGNANLMAAQAGIRFATEMASGGINAPNPFS